LKVIGHPDQRRHYPEQFIVNGVFRPNPELPERFDRLLAAALDVGCEPVATEQGGMECIAAVHTPRYLAFLERAHERWRRIDGASAAVTPNIHPDHRGTGYPASVVAQAGYHMADAAAPIGPSSWQSILLSAWTAAHATRQVLAGDAAAYALCRPPGHHAFADLAGGFCYLNNSAIAARLLRERFGRVAILDVDLHHGNGTQAIFYRCGEVFTVSIHADPERFYPFFWGYAAEEGEGAGEGCNLNLPLARGSGDDEFLKALEAGLARIGDFAPGALVVALGLDAFEGDPFGGLRVSTEGFGVIGKMIARDLPLPTVLVQEGGYLCDGLGDNLAAFLEGFGSGNARLGDTRST
jgi:acetoin utilization deacetylase AcuC-like enzyme